MINRPPLAELIESAIGAVGLQSISYHENHVVSGNEAEIRERLLLLQSAINGATPAVRSSLAVIESLTAILKSTEITCAPEFIAFLGRKYPKMMMAIIEDPVIKNRIQHLYLVMELNQCFSFDSMQRLNAGIDAVRRKVFNLSQCATDIDTIDRAFNVFGDEEDSA